MPFWSINTPMQRISIIIAIYVLFALLSSTLEAIDNPCAREIYQVANNQLVYKVCERFGGFLGAPKRNFPVIEPTKEGYLTEDRLEFLESSWCNRNAQWSTFIFVGHNIDAPEKVMGTVSDWKSDLEDVISKRTQTVYMVTVPRLYGTSKTPPTFFYNTHYFTLQVIASSNQEEDVRFKIYAGFARHYRLIDYLQEWDINEKIPDTHRLKMNRTTYAVESFGRERLETDFLPRLEKMMDEINAKFEWTRTVNDIHADLFYADKFKDMINLMVQGLTKPPQEEAKRFTRTPLRLKSTEIRETAQYVEGESIIFTTKNESALQEEEEEEESPAPERLKLDQVPPNGFYVPLTKPSTGAYYLTIRKYSYKDANCKANADYVKRACYGTNQKKFQPAVPFKMQHEDYGSYTEREAIMNIEKHTQKENPNE